MQVESGVNRRKFDREVERLHAHADQLDRWQCRIKRVDYPAIDLDFELLFRLHPPNGYPQAIIDDVATRITKGNAVLRHDGFGVRVMLDDYDLRAPSLAFHDRKTWRPVTQVTDMMTLAFVRNSVLGGQLQNVMIPQHPYTRRPFLCIRGTREYHEHPEHTGDNWLLHRATIGVFTLALRVAEACVMHCLPVMFPVGPNAFQLRWMAV